jgi:hypothetical protein
MAAAAIVKVLVSGTRKYVINVSGVWDTADEVDTVIIDRSTLIGPDGVNIPTYIRIDEITWAVGPGFNSVLLSWDDAADENIDYYQGQGYMDYRPYGGKSMSAAPTTATEGDLQLTSEGGSAGDTYSFIINCTLKN